MTGLYDEHPAASNENTIAPSKKSFFILLCFFSYRINHSRTSGGITSELLVLRR